MYLPEWFAEDRPEIIQTFIRQNPLGTLVTIGSEGLNANHIPFLFDPELGPHGTLRGHVARKNVVWHDTSPKHEALVIFQGPSAYISPNWYPTKAETHKHVPTYNYAVVHAYGPLVVQDDEKWLRGFVGRLTKTMEAGQPRPWKMGDAPQDYLREMLGQIVGIEIPVTRLVGKWKVSQNRLPVDQQGAAEGLRSVGDPEADAMAELILQAAAGAAASQ